MLKLFYSPGACSLVTHIALEESGAEFEPVRVTLAQAEHLKPEYLEINPHARVPALATGHGVVTENIAILNLIADLFGKDGSVPRDDPYAAARCNELLGWFASTVHISFAQIWRAARFPRDESIHPAIVAGESGGALPRDGAAESVGRRRSRGARRCRSGARKLQERAGESRRRRPASSRRPRDRGTARPGQPRS
jgi:glutathione S-transferase